VHVLKKKGSVSMLQVWYRVAWVTLPIGLATSW